MTAASATADPFARTRLRVATLEAWADAGVELAQTVVANATRDFGQASRALMRIAQAIRLATLLAIRLCDPTHPAVQPAPVRARAAAPAAAEAAAPARLVRRGGVGRGDREVSDAVLLRLPVNALVRRICRILGVTPDWSLWSDDDPTPAAPEAAPSPPRRAPGRATPPDSVRSIPEPRPRPRLVLDRPTRPPPAARLRRRLLGVCAPGALIPTFPPLVRWRADTCACPETTRPGTACPPTADQHRTPAGARG